MRERTKLLILIASMDKESVMEIYRRVRGEIKSFVEKCRKSYRHK